jgi:hypothetical protein
MRSQAGTMQAMVRQHTLLISDVISMKCQTYPEIEILTPDNVGILIKEPDVHQ